MRNIFLALLYTLSISSILFAQIDFLTLNAEYATFKRGNDKTYLEIYLSHFQNDLIYQYEDSLLVAHFQTAVKIFQGDSVIHEAQNNYKNSRKPEEKIVGNNQFMDVFPVEIDPGEYKCQVTVMDENSQKFGEYELNLHVPAYGDGFIISSIELASRVNKVTQNSKYTYKSNVEICPNPSSVFGISNPMLYFYFEVYNAQLDEKNVNKYSYHYYITDTEEQIVKDYGEKIKSTNSSTVAEISGTNVMALATDSYLLNIEVKDLLSGATVNAVKKFAVEKPTNESTGLTPVIVSQPVDEYYDFTEEQLKTEFATVQYIATREEKKVFEDLDLEGMRKFLSAFWKRRDPSPGTPVNEFKRKYFQNVRLAIEKFTHRSKEGWRTERGRVLLTYGNPDEIDRQPSTVNSRPYEVWHYYQLDGGSQFIFGDTSGYGDYELLHSTYRSEIQNPNWGTRVGIAPGDVMFR